MKKILLTLLLLCFTCLAWSQYAALMEINETKVGTLSTSDFSDEGTFIDFYQFEVTTRETIAIELESNDFDTYMFVSALNGGDFHDNDDRVSGDTDSYIEFTPDNLGSYIVGASSFAPKETGSYTLELTQEKPRPISSATNTNQSSNNSNNGGGNRVLTAAAWVTAGAVICGILDCLSVFGTDDVDGLRVREQHLVNDEGLARWRVQTNDFSLTLVGKYYEFSSFWGDDGQLDFKDEEKIKFEVLTDDAAFFCDIVFADEEASGRTTIQTTMWSPSVTDFSEKIYPPQVRSKNDSDNLLKSVQVCAEFLILEEEVHRYFF